MAPSTREDTTVALDAATAEVDGPVPTAWHDRPAVLIASALVGLVGLIALVVSVVDTSEQSEHPSQSPATAASVTTPPAPPQTTDPVVAAPTEPPPALPAATNVPDFAAGPTAEMLVPPTPAAAAPEPYRLPRWLRRLLHQDDGPD